MNVNSLTGSRSRRNFLAATGGLLAAASLAGSTGALGQSETDDSGSKPVPQNIARKIPIGVFDPVFDKLSLDEMIEKIAAMGIEAVEIGTGGYPGTAHCPVQELLEDPAKLRAWKK